ncbi:ribose-5-phosphate isomerase RpiA [Tetragenococcus muriaticus]|uniref:ribose-5-phosphate isomerase RpiA n=1 Tax=Tetragenococcus muriaticus TaxID=64642 RepID=UPI000417B0C8|nr:ribose-5-phosphate isomerase RpiA [Tetragenococcus muriaticus]GMA47996.1 ribose-5-phosphate isomerase A [Tetragenococcus muriaticus]
MNIKKNLGNKAAEFVKSGMVIGLGTGSTVYYFVEALGKKVAKEKLDIVGITTSNKTKEHASSLNIPLKSLDEVDSIDLTIDGADEVSNDFHGIKGGGGALLFEKLVASNSKKNVWIIEDSKRVKALGKYPLPVEVVKYGSEKLFQKLEKRGYKPTWRLTDSGNNFLTDDDNYIIDLHLRRISSPHEFSRELIGLVGVVEHGLFLDTVDTVIVGSKGEIEIIDTQVGKN